MSGRIVILPVLAAVIVGSTPGLEAQVSDPGRLYARVTTMDGDQFEGFIRWDNNEGHWTDVLDASKRIPSRYTRTAGRGSRSRRSVNLLGIRISTSGNTGPTRQSGLRMGHIQTIQVLDESHALVTLKSGEEQELRRSSSDLGRGMRDLLIQGATDAEPVRLDWDDIDYVEFAPAPTGIASPFGPRMYGVLELENGDEFTGWITWDMDEIFGLDELDGDADGRRRRIRFEEIASITPAAGGSDVALRTGESMRLRGTNDVNSGNRGIAVGDPGLGQVRVRWRDLRSVRFQPLPGEPGYPRFDGGAPLRGTVTLTDGTMHTGTLRWDNDEAYTWELLDGDLGDMEFKIEFGLIASIEPTGSRGARVTLRDGRSFELTGSNDVNEGNNGVFVETELGEAIMVEWGELARVDFRP